MKRHDTAPEHLKVEQRRDVAVPDERLAGSRRRGSVQQWQELRAAVPATRGDQRGNRRIDPRTVNRRRAELGRASQVSLAGEDRVVVHGVETEPTQLFNPALELIAVKGAGWGDNGNPIAGHERTRLSDHANRAISSATRR
jgi:hypothetical protein